MHVPPQDFPEKYRIVDPTDPYEMGCGPFFTPLDDDGDPRIVLLAGPGHCNASGILHGGLLVTMADLAIYTEAVRGQTGEGMLTVSLNSDFVAAASEGAFVEARAEVTRRTGSLAFLRAQITSGDHVLLNCNAVVKRLRAG